MRLAFVTSLLPTGQPDTGFEIANACVIGALRDVGCEVRLFGLLRPGGPDEPPADAVVLDRMVIENAEATAGRKAGWLAASLRLGLPVIAAKLAPLSPRLRAALDREGPFDAVVVNSAPVAAAFPWLLQRWPAILVAHNVEHATAAENARNAGALGALLYRREARLLRGAEHEALARARHVWCFSEEDRVGFGMDIEAKSTVLPLLTPAPAKLPKVEATFDVGLIGTWTWRPNLAGLRWFLDEVAPRLPADLAIAVAGRLPAGLASADGRVRLLGRVPDAAAFVAGARVMALTSRTGTGVQLKTIETFQLGKPAVATRSSVRGMSALPMNCLVAEDAPAFAAALAKLVADVRSERTRKGDGRAFVQAQRKGLREGVVRGLEALKGMPAR